MRIFKRVCLKCNSICGCKFHNRYGDLITWSCDTCLLKGFAKDCLCEDKNEIEVKGTLCDKCRKEIENDKARGV